MQKLLRWLVIGGLAAALAEPACGQSAVTLGLRRHAEHASFHELPFGNGDLSYAAGYELHTSAALWQLALDYAPDVTRSNDVHALFTPQLNLMFKDRIWRAGVGVLDSYIERRGPASDEWTSPYWQFLFGVSVPIHKFALGATVYYPFAHWGALGEFDFRDLDYGVSLSYMF